MTAWLSFLPKKTLVTENSAQNNSETMKLVFRFVLIIGIANFFADFTYEGARSSIGPFLGSLGASAAAVGFVAGFGEMVGYVLRYFTGLLAQKTHKYWMFAVAGYAVNMLAVPALALAGNWPSAAALVVAERTGRAIRKPSVETMLSYATHTMGRGWVFGLNEALDQAGATLGPLTVALVLYLKGGYRQGFAVLLISAVLCLATIIAARFLYPRPHELDRKPAQLSDAKALDKAYWLYVVAAALIAAGFADFALISFHFEKAAVVSKQVVPVYYSVAMAMGAISALVFGRMLDKLGFGTLIFAFFLEALFAPFAFSTQAWIALLGMVLWGVGIGAQDALLKAELTAVVPADKRGSAFGLFDTVFGIAWFAGSAAMGLLYQVSLPAMIALSVVLQLAALPIFLAAKKCAENSYSG